jgi:predicted negative regulator of RcsB-dependent stress response
MKRPQQKKNKSLFPEAKDEAANIDERNLVDAEESAEIAIEERISMYWMENKAFVGGCIAVLALVIIGFNGLRIYGNYTTGQQQAHYLEAQAEDSLDRFAKEHADLELGGFAALRVADAAFEAGDFERAREHYALAAEALADSLLRNRARLSLAITIREAGDPEAARTELEALAADPAAAEILRAEAIYYLAVSAHLAGHAETLASLTEQIKGLAQAGPWQQRLLQLR